MQRFYPLHERRSLLAFADDGGGAETQIGMSGSKDIPRDEHTVAAEGSGLLALETRLRRWGKKLHLAFVGKGGGEKRVYELLTQLVRHLRLTKKLHTEVKPLHEPKATTRRGRRRRNKNRDVWLNRHPRGRTYCSSSTFDPSRSRNHSEFVLLLTLAGLPLHGSPLGM
jgi:hypothetical protein